MKREKQIEDAFIAKLQEQGYTYNEDIRSKDALQENFRRHFERLNQVELTDEDFTRLLSKIITSNVFEASKALRQTNSFALEDDKMLHYTLVNLEDWCKNEFEVINQLQINDKKSYHRYDVMLLINGLPIVQIELKSYGISPKVAMEQIVRYKNDPGNGYTNTLLCFMQIFVVSNESHTFYFSNNANKHFNFNKEESFLPVYHWADKENKKVTHLHYFVEVFLGKYVLSQMISKYMVLVETETQILMMRPYQIYAVKAIVDCIEQNRGNGYIWHTTGSGKTLTSFKAATLLKSYPEIEKCIFVVDRKDLDQQTRDEFNKFQEGCVEENTNTKNLVERMLSNDLSDKIIVTTIQKLGLALDENSKGNRGNKRNRKKTYAQRLKSLKNKRVVFIFDECHRSQFGENHKSITTFFPQSQLFGFTGTPIFETNSTARKIDGKNKTPFTTGDVFEKELHAYTITNAIEDKNVLRFNIDYFDKERNGKTSKKEVLPVKVVVDAIIEKHDLATNHRTFNAILATSSIDNAIAYYQEFQRVQEDKQASDEGFVPLKVACVFSPPAEGNKDVRQLQEDLEQEKKDNKENPEEKKEALTKIINDYNQRYGANHSVQEFDKYYKDVQKRIKDQKYPITPETPKSHRIDLVIVVDMLLTGFDSKYLNTIYVDKNLKYHGLIQAFSRTNRVLNDTKPLGNILDFRRQDGAVDEAIELFSGMSQGSRAREIWIVEPAPKTIEKYQKAKEDLKKFMEIQGLDFEPSSVVNLKGNKARIEFIKKFREIQKIKTQLDQYTGLRKEEREEIEKILPIDSIRGFRTEYLDIARDLKKQQGRDLRPRDGGEETDLQLVLFKSIEVDYDYIMKLIARSTQDLTRQKMTRGELIEEIIKQISSNANFMDDKEDLIAYVATLKSGKGLSEREVKDGYQAFKAEKMDRELSEIAKRHGLNDEKVKELVTAVMDRMILNGGQLTHLLKPLGLGWEARYNKEEELMKDLAPHLRKRSAGQEISGLSAYE